jgi:RecB family exonuclease
MSPRCENAVFALATGGLLRRAWARYHAARCPRCAAAQRKLASIAKALADVPPLTAEERRVWTAAIGDGRPAVVVARRLRPAALVAFALTLVMAIPAAWWMLRRQEKEAPPLAAPPAAPAIVADTQPLVDLESLRRDVLALSDELDELQHRAELLDARRDVDALLARFTPTASSNGL